VKKEVVSREARTAQKLPGLQLFIKPIRKHYVGVLFVLPCLVLLITMMVNPITQTFKFSVSHLTLPTFDTRFVGLDNFTRILSRADVSQVFANTAIWIVGSIFLKFVVGFWAALVMNANVRGIMAFRVMALLPWTVPSIVAANTWRWVFHSDYGLINGTLASWGLGQYAHLWLGDPTTALPAVILAYSWAGYPFVMLMLLAGMQGIPKEYYEAAQIDGANDWQLFRYITVPSLKAIIFIVLLLEFISGLNSFDMLYVMTAGGPGGASQILGILIYRLGFNNFDFAGASALSVILIVIVLLGFVFYAPTVMKGREGR
jgi:multiple sugar transport system permease protein